MATSDLGAHRNATELDKSERAVSKVFVSSDNTAKIGKSGKVALRLPATVLTGQRATILHRGGPYKDDSS